MVNQLINDILYHYSYLLLYGIVLSYFLFLYFGLGTAFLKVCEVLHAKKWLNKIVDKEVSKKQITYEIKHSLLSIFIFGFSGFPIIYLVRTEQITVLENSLFNVIWGLVLLTIWNEIHFFLVHRLMHIPFFLKKVHYIHHRSTIPTIYSIYSFHALEAVLLSTVPFLLASVIPLSSLAIFLFPIVSILLNYAGHCNYRFGKGLGNTWQLFATNHNEHHSKGKQNYGFASDLLDRFYQFFKKN